MSESSAPAPDLEAPEAAWPEVDRRVTPDRRAAPTRVWDSLLGRRRRRIGRREGEGQNAYVDRFRRRDVALLVAIFSLNIFDAALTLLWLQRGGSEGNPVMDWALGFGNGFFLFQKCAVAGVWLLVLVVHKNFRIARIGLWGLFVVYAVLAAYHLVLYHFGVPTPAPAPSP